MNLTQVQCYICNIKFVENNNGKPNSKRSGSGHSAIKQQQQQQKDKNVNYNGAWQVFCQYFYGGGNNGQSTRSCQGAWDNNISGGEMSFCTACRILLDKLNMLHEQLECIQKNISTVVNTISATIIHQAGNQTNKTNGNPNLLNPNPTNYICNTPQFPQPKFHHFEHHHHNNQNQNQNQRQPEYSMMPAFPGQPWPNNWTNTSQPGQGQIQGQGQYYGSVLNSTNNKSDETSSYFTTQVQAPTTKIQKKSSRSSSTLKGHQGQNFTKLDPNDGPILLHANKYQYQKLGDDTWRCGTCGTRKSNKSLLVTHLNYHRLLDSKKWICSICEKSFSRQREVSRHERTHFSNSNPQNNHNSTQNSSKISVGANKGILVSGIHGGGKITADHSTPNGLSFLYGGVWPFEQLANGIGFRCITCGTLKDKKASMLSHLRWVHHQKQNKVS